MGEWRGEGTSQAIEEAIVKARQLQDQVGRGPGGRELALTITKLEEALLWLSKVQ